MLKSEVIEIFKPQLTHFEDASRCSIKCPHCYVNLTRERDMNWRSTLLIKKIGILKLPIITFGSCQDNCHLKFCL